MSSNKNGTNILFKKGMGLSPIPESEMIYKKHIIIFMVQTTAIRPKYY